MTEPRPRLLPNREAGPPDPDAKVMGKVQELEHDKGRVAGEGREGRQRRLYRGGQAEGWL